jgi:hypothetical protein
MKKFLLFAAAAAAMMCASAEVTVEQLWKHDVSTVLTTGDVRQGVGMDGKIFINDKGTQKVLVFGQGGLADEEYPGGMNCGIGRDEAGNLVISNAEFPGAWVCDGETPVIKVVNPNNPTEVKEYALPEEVAGFGRADLLGFAKGNLLEDGVLYICGAGSGETIVVMTITDGEVDNDQTYNAVIEGVSASSNPIYFYQNKDGEDRLLYVNRTVNGTKILVADDDNFAVESTPVMPGKSASNGAQIFVWNGEEYAIYPSGANYLDGFSIVKLGEEEALYVKEAELTVNPNSFQANWVNAEVVEGGVMIYHYVPGAYVEAFKMTDGEQVEHTYAVTGTPAALFGMENDWDPVAAPEMTLNANGIYEWTSEETALEAGDIELKVVQDHAWDVCFPASDDSGYHNIVVTVEEAGTYTLNVIFNPESADVVATLTPVETPVEPAKVYILGEVNGNTWAPNVGVEMETEDNKVFTKEVTLVRPENRDGQKYCFFSFATKLMEAADDWDGLAPYRFGAVSNGDFLFEPDMMGQPLALTAENGQAFQVPEGEYTLTVDLENMTLTIEGTIYSGIEYINTVNVKNVRFYNLQGMESTTPFQGVNIVVSEMTDGSKVITKVVK